MMRLLRTILLLAASAAAGVFATVRKLLPGQSSPAAAAEGAKPRMLRLARHFALFLVLFAAGGFLFAASGVFPIGASSGHWGITQWFLNFASRRAVVTHTLGGTEPPPLDDRALLLKGAGHYETGCRPCHGSPDLRHPRIAQQMLPRPPYLPAVIPSWEPDELFFIVKNGFKFTGMPAWPTQVRDDEVWAMVAFLLALPELDAQEYQRLAWGEGAESTGDAPLQELVAPEGVPLAVTQSCARCHGIDGLGRGTGAFPKLAGQSPSYLYASLIAYADGQRHSGIMEPIAAGLSSKEMRELSQYYGSLKRASLPPSSEASVPAVRRGEAIALQGIPSISVPACSDCHGPSAHRRNPFYPTHAGQYADYLVLQLELFQQSNRGGTAYANLMHPVAARLTPQQMRDVALYYESLASAPDSNAR